MNGMFPGMQKSQESLFSEKAIRGFGGGPGPSVAARCTEETARWHNSLSALLALPSSQAATWVRGPKSVGLLKRMGQALFSFLDAGRFSREFIG